MYGAVTGNIALTFILNSFFGSAAAQPDGSVVICPTTVEGMPITGLVFGLILGVLVTNGVLKSMKTAIHASGPSMLASAICDKRFSWMPKRKGALMCLVTIVVMIFSAVALPAIMLLFGKSLLNFYQFVLLITVYATLISKPLSFVLIRRCMQSDFISYHVHR
jgi:hypothetical protein